MTHLIVQESVVLFECHICSKYGSLASSVVLLSLYFLFFPQENGMFQCKMSFCIHNEDTYTFLLRIYTLEKYSPMMMSPPYHMLQSWCLLLMFIDVKK
jgi:hypothetical protein